jgi:hypothetical protein
MIAIGFTLSAADDLIWLRRGGLKPNFSSCLVMPAPLANERNKTMSDNKIDQIEEEILSFEVSDAALESAAGTVKEKAGAFTLSFCSGLDTCPA